MHLQAAKRKKLSEYFLPIFGKIMFCSTVIPTIGRATLARAVNSVLTQSFPNVDKISVDFEVIVVNDSGKPLPEADWQQSDRVRIIHTNRHERSIARNTGAAIAQGDYLHFLDDDDWMLPSALENLWTLAHANQTAAWLYGTAQVVDRAERPLLQWRYHGCGNCFVQVMAGEWIPLMASLIKRENFFAVGGFNPLIAGPEDIDLLRRLALHGHLAATAALVTCIGLGAENSTTNQARHAEFSRWAREKILNEPNVFVRMWDSADSGAWHGRLTRIYLTSMVWNLRRKHWATAIGRTALGLAGIVVAGRAAFSPSFWRALFSQYESETFQRGFAVARAAPDGYPTNSSLGNNLS